MLDRQNHELILKKIIRDMYEHPLLAASLGFKGGTCLYMFHGLDRFSTDLDFNILNDDFKPEEVTKILERYLSLEEARIKYHTWFWLGSFSKGKQKVKVEISKREYPDRYVISDYYGLSVRTMLAECMFAHKLCAITNRKKMANRDLYDAWFMLKNNFEADGEIVKLRTEKTLEEYFKYLADFIEKNADPRHILQGMGELLDDKQKAWVKNSLKKGLVMELRLRGQRPASNAEL